MDRLRVAHEILQIMLSSRQLEIETREEARDLD